MIKEPLSGGEVFRDLLQYASVYRVSRERYSRHVFKKGKRTMLLPTRKYRSSFILLTTAILILFTSACGFYAPALGKFTQSVDISIPAEKLTQSSPSFTVCDHDIYDILRDHDRLKLPFTVCDHNFYDDLLDDVRLELHDGYLRFVGTNTQPDGSRVPGSIDLYLGAEDDRLAARIIAVDIPGIDITDPLVVEINQDLMVQFSWETFTPGADVLFKDVQVTEEELIMKLEVTIRF